jgi:DNA modification methylase
MDFDWINFDEQYNICKYIGIIWNISAIYILWILVHYISAHLYVRWCVPATIVGFITAPVLVPAPHCHALRWSIYTGGERIFAMWIMIGSWILNKINMFNEKKTQ